MALKQRLEIVKALATDARILLLDEPTAVLAPAEAEELLRVVRVFTARGGAAVLITHKLDEVLAAAERVTILRQGTVVFEGSLAGQTASALAAAMIGGSLSPLRARQCCPVEQDASAGHPASAGTVLVRLEDLEVPRDTGYGIAVRGATLSIRAGEIVGIAAVEGNGQRELLRAVAGRLPPLRGRREVAGPVGFVPEDRTTEGLIPEFTLTENVVLGSRTDDPWVRRGRIDWRVARARTGTLLKEFGIAAPGPDVRAAALSGGNQQKLVMARELAPGAARDRGRESDSRPGHPGHRGNPRATPCRRRPRGRRPRLFQRPRRSDRARGSSTGRVARGADRGAAPRDAGRGGRADGDRWPLGRRCWRCCWGWGFSRAGSSWPDTMPRARWRRCGRARPGRGMH